MPCANCSTVTTGAFCSACGQRTEVTRLAVRELLGLALALRICFAGAGRTVAEELVLVSYAYGFAVLLQVACAVVTAATGIAVPFAGALPLLWTAFGAMAFHPCRGWSSVLRTVAAYLLWMLILGAVALLVVGLLELLGVRR